MKLYTTDAVFLKETDDFPQNYTGMIIDQSETKRWYKNGVHHRDEDLPSVIYSDGKECWYQNGYLHREIGPASKTPDDYMVYYIKGKLHREDGPAILSRYQEEWYINNKLHNKNGPAIVKRLEDSKINKEWWINGKRHRLDGPAFEYEYFRFGRPKISYSDDIKIDMSDEEYELFKKDYENKVLDSSMKKISYIDSDIKIVGGKECLELWYFDGKKVTKEACGLLSNILKIRKTI